VRRQTTADDGCVRHRGGAALGLLPKRVTNALLRRLSLY
jgi:hypothetical protein